jgi:predicted ribosomally synthesized peptide with nif11-like leader
MSIQHVKAFYEKLSQDQVFRDQIKNSNKKEDFNLKVKTAGYNFTQQEFEDYTAQLLEADISSANNVLKVGERELNAIRGGFIDIHDLVPIYGSPSPPELPPDPSNPFNYA